jgi:galactose mutarotase-like enzyme
MTETGADAHDINAPRIAARIAAHGAELVSLRSPRGHEYLWQAGAEWPRHAPVLFPIVGRLRDDRLRWRGRDYRMTQHGFARDRQFAWVERGPHSCVLALADDAQTRALYPFAFRFEVGYVVADATLSATFTVVNTGDDILPVSIGAHPGFAWPLRAGLRKEAHVLEFEHEEPAPIRRVAGGLLQPDTFPTPVEGRVLRLREDLFAADAVILDHPSSTSVRYGVPGGPWLTVAWEGFRALGLWMMPGAAFLCIEPWRGHASPAAFDGEFSDKPGLMLVPPGERRLAAHRVTIPLDDD